jgi:hypothetical protein
VVSGATDTAHKWPAVSLALRTTKSEFKVEYLGEFEYTFETALTHGSGTQIELFDKKIEVENFVTGSL